jgi:hypothetical protein
LLAWSIGAFAVDEIQRISCREAVGLAGFEPTTS